MRFTIGIKLKRHNKSKWWWIGLALFMIGCNDTGKAIEKGLEGTIAGDAWEYRHGRLSYDVLVNQHTVQLFGNDVREQDRCNTIFSESAHITLIIPPGTGTFDVLNEATVQFEQPGIQDIKFSATSGFVDISFLGGGQVAGYIQAYYDDQNTIEGSFYVNRCP